MVIYEIILYVDKTVTLGSIFMSIIEIWGGNIMIGCCIKYM